MPFVIVQDPPPAPPTEYMVSFLMGVLSTTTNSQKALVFPSLDAALDMLATVAPEHRVRMRVVRA